MRHLGELDSADKASAFQDFMLTNGVSIHVDEEADHWSIWVKEEDDLEKASDEFEQFCSYPDDSKYYETRKNAEAIRQQEAKRIKEIADRRVDVRNRWRKPLLKACPVTLALIVISVVVFLGMDVAKKKEEIFQFMSIANKQLINQLPLQERTVSGVLKAEMSRGEIWRVVTPIFMHFGIFHILFNMMWTKDLGTIIEFKNGSLKMLIMVLLIATVSNLAQFYFRNSPHFGGMSGVVFGLFGYIWMKSKFFPGSGFYINPNTVFLMIGWLILCTTGAMGPIANYAHGFGLVSGMVLAFIPVFDS